MSRILHTTAGTLRAPWRLLLFVVSFIGASFLAYALIAPLIGGALQSAGILGVSAGAFIELVAALAATWFMLRWVERRPWKDVGLHRAATNPRAIGLGLAVGSGAITLAIVLLIVCGWLDRVNGTTDVWAGPLLRMSLLLLPAAFMEELIARGYILTALKEALGWGWAVGITSIGFGLLHLQNPGAGFQSVVLVSLAGVFLAAVRIGTDSLYAAWAAHFAWNWVMAALFHVHVSGLAFEYPGYRYVDAGPDWATGGSWGPESGVPAGIMMVLAGLAVMRWSARIGDGKPGAKSRADSH